MARRWQLSLWVMVGLTLAVLALWDSASSSVVVDGVGQRTEAVGRFEPGNDDASPPSDLAFGDLDSGGLDGGDANLLRPTTTTTRPTTTAPTSPAGHSDGDGRVGEQEPGSATTTPRGDSPDPSVPPVSTPTTTRTPTSGDGNEPGLTTVFYEDFSEGQLKPGQWEIYDSPGHAGWGLRRPSAVTVAPDAGAAGGHVLQITAAMGQGDEAGQLVSGGMRLLGHSMAYGRYSFRARVEPDPDEATSGVVLLWPADNVWPEGGEIDIMETWGNRSTRTPVESHLHWPENGQDKFVGLTHVTEAGPVSAAQWHVYTLDWAPNRVTVSIDGGQPMALSNDADHIPQSPMDLTVQLDAFDRPSAPGQQPIMQGEVNMMVDWIRVERAASRSGV